MIWAKLASMLMEAAVRIAAVFMIRRWSRQEVEKEILEDENAKLKDVIGLDDDALADELRERAKAKRNKD